MSRVCEVTGRRTQVGHAVKRRGLTPDGQVLRMKLSTKAIKGGMIRIQKGDKVVEFPLVKALRGRNRAFTKAQKG
jgi:ribosomal protein L28